MGKHRNSRLTATWLLGTIAAAAIMAGDQAQAADCMEMGGSDGQKCLAIASALEPGSLFVIRDGDDGNTLVNWSISEPLVDRDATGTLVPVLAEEMPVADAEDPTIWAAASS